MSAHLGASDPDRVAGRVDERVIFVVCLRAFLDVHIGGVVDSQAVVIFRFTEVSSVDIVIRVTFR
jgi:hypothetical protein